MLTAQRLDEMLGACYAISSQLCYNNGTVASVNFPCTDVDRLSLEYFLSFTEGHGGKQLRTIEVCFLNLDRITCSSSFDTFYYISQSKATRA